MEGKQRRLSHSNVERTSPEVGSSGLYTTQTQGVGIKTLDKAMEWTARKELAGELDQMFLYGWEEKTPSSYGIKNVSTFSEVKQSEVHFIFKVQSYWFVSSIEAGTAGLFFLCCTVLRH